MASPVFGFPTFSQSRSAQESGVAAAGGCRGSVGRFGARQPVLGTGFELCALYSLANTISVAAGATLIGKLCGERKSAISGRATIRSCC